MDALRLLERLHGHAGWLTAALLVHPAIVLRNRTRRAHLAVVLATLFVSVVFASGSWLYVAYRQTLRAGIFRDAPGYGLLFERKEHLAIAALCFAWTGACAYFAATRVKPPVATSLRTIAFRSFVASAALAIVGAAFATAVASFRSF